MYTISNLRYFMYYVYVDTYVVCIKHFLTNFSQHKMLFGLCIVIMYIRYCYHFKNLLPVSQNVSHKPAHHCFIALKSAFLPLFRYLLVFFCFFEVFILPFEIGSVAINIGS